MALMIIIGELRLALRIAAVHIIAATFGWIDYETGSGDASQVRILWGASDRFSKNGAILMTKRREAIG